MGEPVIYVRINDFEAVEQLSAAITADPTTDESRQATYDVLDRLYSNGYYICRAEP